MLPRLADLSVDVFTNFISLSEMDYGSIVEYLAQVDRDDPSNERGALKVEGGLEDAVEPAIQPPFAHLH